MKETYTTEADALNRIAQIDRLMGFPDNHGTLTYAVPTPEDDGTFSIEVGSDVPEINETKN